MPFHARITLFLQFLIKNVQNVNKFPQKMSDDPVKMRETSMFRLKNECRKLPAIGIRGDTSSCFVESVVRKTQTR